MTLVAFNCSLVKGLLTSSSSTSIASSAATSASISFTHSHFQSLFFTIVSLEFLLMYNKGALQFINR